MLENTIFSLGKCEWVKTSVNKCVIPNDVDASETRERTAERKEKKERQGNKGTLKVKVR